MTPEGKYPSDVNLILGGFNVILDEKRKVGKKYQKKGREGNRDRNGLQEMHWLNLNNGSISPVNMTNFGGKK